LVAGSTHPGEEEIILSAYRKLLNEFPDLRLLIAPRHPERSQDLVKLIKRFGFISTRISILDSQTHGPTDPQTIFILDTVGVLLYFYSIADIVFVGGSLVKIGGHNILEPTALGKPVLIGPYMFNFSDIADLFIINKAAILVRNQEELKENIRYLLNNHSLITELRLLAKELILENQGATKRNMEFILGLT
jgi:3-deoxy-D-manno-octulosonic-acid transferase